MDELLSEFETFLLDPLIRSQELSHGSDDLKNIVNLFKNGKYQDVLNLHSWIFSTSSETSLNEALHNFLKDNQSNPSNSLQLFCVGVSSLHLFVQSNWLGYSKFEINYDQELENEARKTLVLDGECFYPTIKGLKLLQLAKIIILDLQQPFISFKLLGWWMVKYVLVHQLVLEESSQQLYSIFLSVVDKIDQMEENLATNLQYKSLLHLEVGHVYLMYSEVQKAKVHFEKANSITCFNLEWTGALGKRTRYQQSPVPQLTIKVDYNLEQLLIDDSQQVPSDLPKDVKLDDDTRLNQIAFTDKDANLIPDLPPLCQALLIAQASLIEKFHPQDELLSEELSPLLNCILGSPKVWSFHVSSLLKRSKLESTQRRAVERSMTQLQELVDSLSKPSESSQRRIEYFYVSRMPLECELQRMLADVFQSLGAINSALDVYIRLQWWDGVIACYQHLELKHKAEEIVRQELAKEETPKLWCLLGNCTDDVAHYERAWELSKHTSARAQRDWAHHFYSKKKFRESIPHFQESLRVNSLQEGVWIRLAFSAMEVEEWEIAAGAYRRYCSLNSDSFEAWNNVAKCYAKLGQKARAWRALQEAVKCNYENWKVWDNLMVVSVDCCEYDEVVRSYNRILDLKEKHIDVQVLRILVQAIVENKEDNSGQEVGHMSAAVQKLLGRLTSQVTNNAQVWEIYADLVAGNHEGEAANAFRVSQLLQKAHRSAIQEKNWEKDISSCTATLNLLKKYVNSCLKLLAFDNSKENIQLASSSKLSLRSCISQVKLCYEFDTPKEVVDALEELSMLQKDLEEKLTS